MATATRYSEGDYMDFSSGVAIAAGTVVLLNGTAAGSIFGIADQDIPANVQGALAIRGNYKMAKLSSDNMAPGDTLYWDVSNQRCTTTASTHKKIGRCVSQDSGVNATTVVVALNSLYA